MNYDDFALPKNSELKKLAKEYSLQKKSENFELLKANPAILDSVCYSLKFLNWLYSYIKKNLRRNKLALVFDNFAIQVESNFLEIENRFYDSPKLIKLYKSKKINSLNACVKLAIYTEIELVENIFKLFKCEDCEFVEPMIEEHFEILKRLSSI